MPMKIHGSNDGPQRPERAKEVHSQPIDRPDRAKGVHSLPIEKKHEKPVRTAEQVEKQDRVEISDAGRARATARLAPADPAMGDRLVEIRRRVLSGAYDTDQVVAEVANRILDRGDV
jgi:hypothetical protein